MSKLYKRTYVLTVGNKRITGLDIGFKVVKSTKREPNTAEIDVYNLSRESRQELNSGRNVRVQLEAGYVDPGPFLLFRGDIRNAASPRGGQIVDQRDGAAWVTSIEASDGGVSYLQSRVSRSFAPGTSVGTVLRALVQALGIGEGNLSDFLSSSLEGAGTTFPEGTVLDGSASREMDGITRSLGLRWSVQNGVLQLQQRRTPIQSQAVKLSKSTGLVGSPAEDNNGLVKATAFIMPGLDPGRKVVLDAESFSGGYEVRKVEYSGGTSEKDWYAHLELKQY